MNIFTTLRRLPIHVYHGAFHLRFPQTPRYKNFLHEDIFRFILNYFKFLCCCLRDLSKNFHFLLVADIKEYNGLLHIDCSNFAKLEMLLNCLHI